MHWNLRHYMITNSVPLLLQVPIIQVMLGQLGIVNSQQMFSLWRYVVVGSTVAAAVLTPSTDPFTQALLAIPLVGLYMGGATVVKFIENSKTETAGARA
jgi:sec-independent protein translocase protein TatC